MALVTGLLYSLPFQKLTDVKHSKHYHAQAKDLRDRSMFGYEVIKLEQDVVYYVGWRVDSMSEYHAKMGEYLVQAPMQPPRIVKTWQQLRQAYKVFQNQKEGAN